MSIFKDWFVGRPGSVYGIKVTHHVDRSVLIRRGYIGKTRQKVGARVAQHLETQPFSDLMVEPETLWSSRKCTSLRLWWEEVWRIVVFRPIYNYEWNKLNPRRIPIYLAKEQRQARNYMKRRTGYMDRFERRQQGNGIFGQPEPDRKDFELNKGGTRRERH